MMKLVWCGLVLSALSFSFNASALPYGLSDSASVEDAHSSIDEARLFCYRRSSGRFLHWGACYQNAPRVYCRNHWTGEFLHWGAC